MERPFGGPARRLGQPPPDVLNVICLSQFSRGHHMAEEVPDQLAAEIRQFIATG